MTSDMEMSWVGLGWARIVPVDWVGKETKSWFKKVYSVSWWVRLGHITLLISWVGPES